MTAQRRPIPGIIVLAGAMMLCGLIAITLAATVGSTSDAEISKYLSAKYGVDIDYERNGRRTDTVLINGEPVTGCYERGRSLTSVKGTRLICRGVEFNADHLPNP